MMKRTALYGAIVAAFTPNLLLADMNYTFVEVSLLDVEAEARTIGGGRVDVDGDGFEIAGSYELNDQFFVFGKWQDQDLDFGFDGRTVELGGAYVHSFSDKLDFIGQLSYIDTEVKAGNATLDDDGLGLGGGIRARVNDNVQLDAGLKYVDFDDSGNDTGFTFGGRYYYNENLAVGASADFNDNADTLRIGVRFEF
jgi:opacity protein-like surface antigen